MRVKQKGEYSEIFTVHFAFISVNRYGEMLYIKSLSFILFPTYVKLRLTNKYNLLHWCSYPIWAGMLNIF